MRTAAEIDREALKRRLDLVRERIEAACRNSGRPENSVRLVAVSKTKPAEMIQAAIELGQLDFGENYAQELRDKAALLPDPRLRWHFIGSLQRNKVKYVVGRVAMIHSMDSGPLLEEIEKRALSGNVRVPVLLEVKLSEEETKTGIDPGLLLGLAEQALAGKAVELRGLMTMPPYFPEPEQSRGYYARLRQVRDDLEQRLKKSLPELSMGMSNDFEVAVSEGATMVRVGTAIFGAR